MIADVVGMTAGIGVMVAAAGVVEAVIGPILSLGLRGVRLGDLQGTDPSVLAVVVLRGRLRRHPIIVRVSECHLLKRGILCVGMVLIAIKLVVRFNIVNLLNPIWLRRLRPSEGKAVDILLLPPLAVHPLVAVATRRRRKTIIDRHRMAERIGNRRDPVIGKGRRRRREMVRGEEGTGIRDSRRVVVARRTMPAAQL